MNGLYPIVRRVRRPLLPVEAPADAKPAQLAENVKAQAARGVPKIAKAEDPNDRKGEKKE